jgi:hypothetical protein
MCFAVLMGIAGTFAVAATEEARTYYVDAARGNDAHDGLTPETAWQSLMHVSRAALGRGDRVLFRRGEAWRGQLVPQSGAEGRPITYGAYGEGEKPLLLGSVCMSRPEDWQPAGDGAWATAPVRFEPKETLADLSHNGWSLHREGGAACTITRVRAESEDPNGAAHYRLACEAPGKRQNHLQLSAGGLSVREGEYYLFTYRARCSLPFTPAAVVLMRSGPPWTAYAAPVTALTQIGQDWAEHTAQFQARHTADDARLTFFLGGSLPAGAVLEFQPGTLVRAECNQPIPLSADVGNIIFDHGAAVGVKKWSADNLLDEGDYFYDGARWNVMLRSKANPATLYRSIELALNRHIISQGGRGHVTYENLALRYGAAHGIGGGNTHHITVRGCDISYIGGGHQLTRPDGRPVRFGNGIEFWDGARNCLVEDCRLWEIYDAALTNQGGSVNVQENITYRRNVIWNSEYSFEYWNRPEESVTRNIVFEHNTCVDAGHGWGHGQRPDRNGRHLMFFNNPAATEEFIVRHNIFSNATHSLLRLHGREWADAMVFESNIWHQPEGPILLWGREAVEPEELASFAEQQGLSGAWLLAEPGFLDPARRDYRLMPDSPARQSDPPAGALP